MIQEAFWTHDYSSGFEALRESLKGGGLENKQFLAMVRERARIEQLHASQLAHLSQDPALHVSQAAGSSRSSTLQASLDVFNTENVNNAILHTRVATDLEKKVHDPLLKWCNMYSHKVDACMAKLASLVATYQRMLQDTIKQRAVYYERCRQNEDMSTGNSPRDPVISTIRMLRERLNSRRDSASSDGRNRSLANGTTKPVEYTVAGLEYTRQQLADLFQLLLSDIVLTEYKVPLLGSYEHVCSGSMLATASRRHLRNDSFAYAEKFGQSLVDLGFLRPVGQISNKFQSTHGSHYQWQPAAFALLEEASDDSEAESASSHAASDASSANSAGSANTSVLGASDASEERYLQAVLELDVYRCEMEVEMMQIYGFLDRLSRDRERALQAGMRDFVKTAFRLEDQREMQMRLNAAQAAVNPELDLADLVARYETGPFIPTVTVFKGYYNDSVAQTFGVDLEQSRFFVDLTLRWLQAHHSEVARLKFWTQPEPIAEAYKLRTQVNTGRPFNAEGIFKFFSPSVVVSVFIHFLLELPESLVPFTVYDRVKQVYRDADPDVADVVNTFMQVPVENVRVLQQIIDYLRAVFDPSGENGRNGDHGHVHNHKRGNRDNRDNNDDNDNDNHDNHSDNHGDNHGGGTVGTADDAYAKLAESLALPLVRPRAPSSVTMHDQHPKQLVLDLFRRGTEIFESLASEQARAEERKETHRPRVQRNPHSSHDVSSASLGAPPFADPPTPGSQRVISANTLRPLSLASPRAASARAGTSEFGDDSATTPVRGLGINAMLPIAKTPVATPPMSPSESRSGSRNVSPQQTSSPGLRPLRTSTLGGLDVQKRQHRQQ